MALLDIFKGKKATSKEANTVLGQMQLGNQVIYSKNQKQPTASQLLYVTTSSTTTAGRVMDVSGLTRNSTVMSCVSVKARSLAQCGISIMTKGEDGKYIDAVNDPSVGTRDKTKAKQVLSLLTNPNNFQSAYEFWYQWCMWQDITGETFTLWWRKDQNDPLQTPTEMYVLDSTLITTILSETRYPNYRLSTPSWGFDKGHNLEAHQVMHVSEAAWQGSSGFNKGILATELVALDQDIDVYANFIMQNGAKPSGVFYTDQVIPDNKFKEIAARLKETWNAMTGSRNSDPSKAGQGMLLDQGMKYEPISMLTLQDTQTAELKVQTMKRICGVFGVPAAMLGIGDSKYNNTQTMLDEFYKTTMYPMIINIEQKLKQSLLKGYPNLVVRFDTKDFLKGAALDQMNFVKTGVDAGLITPNEAREYLNMQQLEGADELRVSSKPTDNISGTSPQDTGGGGGNQTRKANIGTT
ncbi:COG4695 Phage-related protein [uncultured Caudovirales phage]|uniref:COG4695 Phage-related protein n=1 Tax=uncultured Caudovirales phage TaxID=2100421 RepID=A0A6J7X6J1_9CAUD|nr:COG4695 Phage-related protein [uncultured Caudovirales phage]